MDLSEGLAHRKLCHQGSYISKTFLPVKGKSTHLVPLFIVFLRRFPPWRNSPMLPEHLLCSMVHFTVIYFLFCLFMRVLQITAARVHQSHTEVNGSLKKISFASKRVLEINAQDLNKMGFGPLSFWEFNATFSSLPTSFAHLSAIKFRKKLIVKVVVDQLSENCKLFLLRHSLCVKL